MGCTCLKHLSLCWRYANKPCRGAVAQSTVPVPGFSAGLLAAPAAPSRAKGAPTGYVCMYLGNSHQGV